MRVCVFSIVNYWHGVKGGMEIHGKLLSEGLVKRGHHVSIITTRHPDGKEFEEKDGVKIYYLKNTCFGSRRHGWEMESVSKFRQLHQENSFDVIWSQSFGAYGLAKLKTELNIPVIPILQGCIRLEIEIFRNITLNNYKNPLLILKSFLGLLFSYYKAQKPLLSISSRIITASNEMVDDLRSWHGADIGNRAVPIFNGIDTVHFCQNREYKTVIREKYGIKDNEILMMTLGTLNMEKGHHIAIEVLSLVKQNFPDIKLMIVGTGEYQTMLKEKIHAAGLDNDVILSGFVDNYETVKYYNAADLYLMPTLRVEGLPFVLLEAMSCGKPVVASRIGGNTSVISDGENGFLSEPGDVEQLTRQVQAIIENDKLAERLSSSARKTILDGFSADKMIDATIDVMEKVIK
jgi:glycosyltransferase involved in cell wall biosynthesis